MKDFLKWGRETEVGTILWNIIESRFTNFRAVEEAENGKRTKNRLPNWRIR